MAVVNHCTGCGCRHAVATAHSCGPSLPAAVGTAPHTRGIGDRLLIPDHCSAGDLEDVLQTQRPDFLNLSSTAQTSPPPQTAGLCPNAEPLGVFWVGRLWADVVLASEP
jgi:hypothetical protein